MSTSIFSARSPRLSTVRKLDICRDRIQQVAWSRTAFLTLLLCFLCAPFGSAQVSATLSGIVKDQSGASVTGADVTARNVDTGLSRSTATDQTGRYQFTALPVGQYELRAKKTGFAEASGRGFDL